MPMPDIQMRPKEMNGPFPEQVKDSLHQQCAHCQMEQDQMQCTIDPLIKTGMMLHPALPSKMMLLV